MKGFTSLLLAALVSPELLASAPVTAGSIASALQALGPYEAKAEFRVSMQQLPEDVAYSLMLRQFPAADTDSLSPADYLIDWEMRRDDNEPVKGFSSYFAGNHYRLTSDKFQEYHAEENLLPFTPRNGGARKGVHRSAQFVNLLPAMLADDLRHMAADSSYIISVNPDTLVGGVHRVALNTILLQRGNVAAEGEYLFEPGTLLPVRIHLENNPGTISEQTVDVSYLPAPSPLPAAGEQLSEEMLMELYPEAFSTLRRSNFRIESLVGKRMPSFESPTLSGSRYAHGFHDSFGAPTLVVIMEGADAFTPSTIKDVRDALEQSPVAANVVWAFVDTNPDTVSALTGSESDRFGETTLLGARALARDCGATSFPAIITATSGGVVTDVTAGYNKNLLQNVIQKITFAAGR